MLLVAMFVCSELTLLARSDGHLELEVSGIAMICPMIVREMATRCAFFAWSMEGDLMSTVSLPTTLLHLHLRIYEAARPTAPSPLKNNPPFHIKMAPKNNKGKAKEPEKAGAAKVKGGSYSANSPIQHT